MRANETKKLSRNIIARRFVHVIRYSVVFITATYLLSTLMYKLYGYDAYVERVYQEMMRGNFTELPMMPEPPVIAVVLAMLVYLMILLLEIGFKSTMLKVSRGAEVNVKALLDGFEFAFKSIAIKLLTAVAATLGMVFFIIPGLIMIYRYRFAIYVMFDNPDKGVIWCMRESARISKGHKLRLFRLHISFLPLILLNTAVSLVMLPIVEFWLTPYMSVAESVLYNEIAGVATMDPMEGINGDDFDNDNIE